MRIAAPIVMITPLLVLAGCSSGGSSTSGPVSLPPISSTAPTVSAEPSESPSPSPSAKPSSAGPTMSDSVGPSASPSPTPGSGCATSALTVTLGASQGAAGHQITPLLLTNSSAATCSVVGFPGVSFVMGDSGMQVGAPAVHDGASGAKVTLAPGDAASALLSVVNPDNYDADTCKPVAIKGFRVYPPNQTAATFVALPDGTTACSDTGIVQIRVKTLVAGS